MRQISDEQYEILTAIVTRLPSTADGKIISFGMNFYVILDGRVVGVGALGMAVDDDREDSFLIDVRDGEGNEWQVRDDKLYSTEAAAKAAR